MELINPIGFKKIVDPDGTFQMLIPSTWRYWVIEGHVHSFEDNELSGESDCFQLSIMALKEEERNQLAETLGNLPPTPGR